MRAGFERLPSGLGRLDDPNGDRPMPLTPEQRLRVLDAITSGRLRLDAPTKMYAGFGAGRTCDGCGEVIDRTQVEHEAVYERAPGSEAGQDGSAAGQVFNLHLGCAGLWDVERRRRQQAQTNLEHAQDVRERAQVAVKHSAQLHAQADVLARELEAAIEKSRKVKRGEQPAE
jgi:hypothetical protein